MTKYKFCSMNIPHGVAVQMNSKNNKKRLFSVAGKSGLSSYMPISKEYLDISHIANDQEHSPYVMFVCSDKKDKTIVTNDFQTFKIRNWKKKVKLCTDREHDKALVENFAKFETKHTTQIFEQSDGLIMFVNPYFGEVLYDTITDAVSNTYKFISDCDNNGNRIVCLTEDKTSDNRLACINKYFVKIGKPFYSFVSNDYLNLENGFHLIKYKNEDNFLYCLLNENYKQCSETYVNLQSYHNLILATLQNGQQVFLANNGKPLTPTFIEFEKIGNYYLLKLDNNVGHVFFNPQNATQQLPPTMSDIKICEKYRLVIGNIGSKNIPEYILMNTNNYDIKHNIDPDLSKLFLDFLNAQPVNIYIAKHMVKEPETIVKTLSIFQELLKLYNSEDIIAGIKDRKNLCNKFIVYLKEITSQKNMKNMTYSKSQLAKMNNEYSEFIARQSQKQQDNNECENNVISDDNPSNNIEKDGILNQSQPVYLDAQGYVLTQCIDDSALKVKAEDEYSLYLIDNTVNNSSEDVDLDQLTISDILDSQQMEMFDENEPCF